jgi:prolyl 4-hydroxylase
VYLNDVAEGGETEFPLQGDKIKPEAGKVAIFPSFFSFVHQSNTAISASKYVLVSFTSFAA